MFPIVDIPLDRNNFLSKKDRQIDLMTLIGHWELCYKSMT